MTNPGEARYVAPNPTPAQLVAAELFGYDPHARLGLASKKAPLWDMGAFHPLCAAGVAHDMRTLRLLSSGEREVVNRNFDRDAHLLADAIELNFSRLVYSGVAEAFADIVYAFEALCLIDTSIERTTAESLRDNNVQMWEAMRWINRAARLTGAPIPYPDCGEGDETK